MSLRVRLFMLIAVVFSLTAHADGLSGARAGSQNRTFSKAVADSACKSAAKKIDRIDQALAEQPYGAQTDRLRRMKSRLREQQDSLHCGQSLR